MSLLFDICLTSSYCFKQCCLVQDYVSEGTKELFTIEQKILALCDQNKSYSTMEEFFTPAYVILYSFILLSANVIKMLVSVYVCLVYMCVWGLCFVSCVHANIYATQLYVSLYVCVYLTNYFHLCACPSVHLLSICLYCFIQNAQNYKTW